MFYSAAPEAQSTMSRKIKFPYDLALGSPLGREESWAREKMEETVHVAAGRRPRRRTSQCSVVSSEQKRGTNLEPLQVTMIQLSWA